MYTRPRHLSLAGAKFIAAFEGFRSRPYNDAAGHATIGYGHLLHHGPVTAADRARWGTITKTTGLHLLQADAEIASQAVRLKVKAKINQAQHDALVSFTFNVGTGALAESTLLRQLNTHAGTERGVIGKVAIRQVRANLLKWVKAGSQTLPGLVRRRASEGDLFATGDYSPRP